MELDYEWWLESIELEEKYFPGFAGYNPSITSEEDMILLVEMLTQDYEEDFILSNNIWI